METPQDIGPNGHACWGYDDLRGDFLDAAVPFLFEGIKLGQRLIFVGGPDAEAVVRHAEPLCSLVAERSLQIAPFDVIYPGGRRMTNADQWSLYSGAADQALAAGFTGLRVLAEVTSLGAQGSAHHAAWESYADQRMAGRPLSALCCFDRTVIPEDDLEAIATAHPIVDRRLGDAVPFQLFGLPDGVAVTGEVDAFSSPAFDHLLRQGTDEAAVVLDLSGLTFVDHTALLVIEAHARRLRGDGRELTLRGEPVFFRRLSELMGAAL